MGDELLIARPARALVALLACSLTSCSPKASGSLRSAVPTPNASAAVNAQQSSLPNPNEIPLNKVFVSNEGGISCAATHTIAVLVRHGFNAELADLGSPIVDQTAIQFPSTQTALAERLHRGIPVALMEPTNEVTRVTLILGSNGGVVFGTDISGGFYDCGNAMPPTETLPPPT